MKNKTSLRQLAKELGVSASYLSQVKNGKRPASQKLLSNPSFKVLRNEGKFTAEGGTRTHTPLQEADFKSAASTIPPPRLGD
jgi:transcriptional regulator with XRE-family HTH domain